MYKTIYFLFVFAFININMMATSTDTANLSGFVDHKPVLSEDTMYVCTMHPEVKSLQPGICSKCEMDLVPTAQIKTDSTLSSNTISSEDYYTCSMHPEVHADQPGSCPECGMKLVKKSEASTSKHGMMGMGMMMDSPWMLGMGIIMAVVMVIHLIN